MSLKAANHLVFNYYVCHGDYGLGAVCLSVSKQDLTKPTDPISIKLGGRL